MLWFIGYHRELLLLNTEINWQHAAISIVIASHHKAQARFLAPEHGTQHRLHMLHILVLLNHANLVLVHECFYVGAFLDQPRAQVLAVVCLKGDQNEKNHVEKNIGV